MALFSITDAQLAFGHVALLDHTDFSLEAGERVGLIGRNGTGKSSLLRIVAGMSAPDDGLISRQSGVTCAYVAQEPQFAPGLTVFDAVSQGMGAAHDLLLRYDAALTKLETHNDEATLAELHRVQAELDAADAWQLRTRVETTLAKLALDPHVRVDALSGGLQKRVALAQGLVAEPDILLLDEPTNHLDLPTIEWLEGELESRRCALVLISHDRRFLTNLSRTTAWLDRGRIRQIERGFGAFEEWRDEVLAEEEREQHKLDRKIVNEEHWLRYGVSGRRKRNVKRLGNLHALRDQRRNYRGATGNAILAAAEADKSGRLVIEAKSIAKAFGERKIVDTFSTRIQRGDRVGIVGPNGAGKTTLVHLLIGNDPPDSGSVRLGANIEMATLDQHRESLDPKLTLAEALTGGRGDHVMVGDKSKHVIGYMKDFLFAQEQRGTPLEALSGGERGRLMLARALAKPSNLLILDEPTNDLDLETLDVLEDMLGDYEGTVILISHDRDFLDRVVTSVIVPEGQGRWIEYAGGYSDMLAQRGADVKREAVKADAATEEKKEARAAAPEAAPRRRLSFNEKHALETLPKTIDKLHAEIAKQQKLLDDPDLYAKDRKKFDAASAAIAKAQDELAAAEDRWLELEVLREEIEQA